MNIFGTSYNKNRRLHMIMHKTVDYKHMIITLYVSEYCYLMLIFENMSFFFAFFNNDLTSYRTRLFFALQQLQHFQSKVKCCSWSLTCYKFTINNHVFRTVFITFKATCVNDVNLSCKDYRTIHYLKSNKQKNLKMIDYFLNHYSFV